MLVTVRTVSGSRACFPPSFFDRRAASCCCSASLWSLSTEQVSRQMKARPHLSHIRIINAFRSFTKSRHKSPPTRALCCDNCSDWRMSSCPELFYLLFDQRLSFTFTHMGASVLFLSAFIPNKSHFLGATIS